MQMVVRLVKKVRELNDDKVKIKAEEIEDFINRDKKYQATLYTGYLDDLKSSLTKGVPVLILGRMSVKDPSFHYMTVGPICITPELKRNGYGKILLDYTMDKAKELGCGALCFEGNIHFRVYTGGLHWCKIKMKKILTSIISCVTVLNK